MIDYKEPPMLETIMRKVILLDQDEVLIDTREHVYECTARTLTANGHAHTRDELKRCASHDQLKTYRRTKGLDDDAFYDGPNSVFHNIVRMEESIKKGDVAAVPGAREFISRMSGKYPMAIITSTNGYETGHKFPLLGIDYSNPQAAGIGAVITAEKGSLRKPDAAPALSALEKLGVQSPEDVHIYFVGNGPDDMGCGENLRKLGYLVTTVLADFYGMHTQPPHDAHITNWEEADKIVEK